jgi:ADP-ribose pyrophosphatase
VALIEHPPSVVLIVRDGDSLICVVQCREGADGTVRELPAGTLEPGETLAACADRELAEECGLSVSEWTELGSFWVAPAYSTERATVLAGTVSGIANAVADGDEDIAVERIPYAQAPFALEDATSLAALTVAATAAGFGAPSR